MPRVKSDTPETVDIPTVQATPAVPVVDPTAALAAALVQAIEQTRPTPKKTPFNRTINTPWTPKDGSKKLKLRKKVYQHGMPIDEEIVSNAEIEQLNRLKPGTFLGGAVKVLRRKDRGLDINYPVKTSAQRLKIANLVGTNGLAALVARLVEEAENPAKYKVEDLDQE